jgi:hypothetical protein
VPFAQKVLLCGSSLLMGGLRASLEAMPGLELQQVGADPELLGERLHAWKPDVVLLELEAVVQGLSLSLLQELRRLTLVGLDREKDKLLVLSVRQETLPTAADLVRVIREATEGSGEAL